MTIVRIKTTGHSALCDIRSPGVRCTKTITRPIWLGVIVMLLALSLVGRNADASALYKVVLAQNSFDPSSGITMVAEAKGFFAKEGLDVHMINLTAGKLALDAVLGKAADFGTVAETPLMYAGLAKQPIAIIATTETSYSDVKLIARTDHGIRRIKDLRGKKIATAIGTNAQFFVTELLRRHGLKTSDVHLINLRPQDMAFALARGDIDAYAIWEPFVYRGRKLLGSKATVFKTGKIYLNYFNIVALRPYVNKNPEIVQRFLKALLAAEQYIRKNPSETTRIIARTIGMDQKSFATIRSDFNYHVSLNPGLLALLQKEARWAIASRKAPAAADVAALKRSVDPGPLRSLRSTRVTGY